HHAPLVAPQVGQQAAQGGPVGTGGRVRARERGCKFAVVAHGGQFRVIVFTDPADAQVVWLAERRPETHGSRRTGSAPTEIVPMSAVFSPPPAALPTDKELVLKVIPTPADTNGNGDIFGGWVMAQV